MVRIQPFGHGQACATGGGVLVLLLPSSEPQFPKSRPDTPHAAAPEAASGRTASAAVPWLVARGGRSARRRPPPPCRPTRACTAASHPHRGGRSAGQMSPCRRPSRGSLGGNPRLPAGLWRVVANAFIPWAGLVAGAMGVPHAVL
jgi:hypothetical protein